MQNINLCFITDNSFTLPTAVAIESIVENVNEAYHYNIYIICNKDVELENQAKLLSCTKNKHNITIQLVIVDDDSKYRAFEKKDFPVSISATFKFSIAELLPDVNKILYLDGDLIVQSDLVNFFSSDISDVYAGVIKDYHALTFKGDVWERLGIRLDGYFNSGVMLLNLEKMREDGMFEKLIDYRLNGVNYYMDQDTLNVVFGEKVKYLDFKYNATVTNWRNKTSEDLSSYYGMEYQQDKYEYLRKAEVVHFCSSDKPWRYYDTHYADVWYKYFLDSVYRNENLERKSLHTIISQEQIKNVRIQKNEIFAYNGAHGYSTTAHDPIVTVILPAYNAEDYLAESIQSVLCATFASFELICVNDGSTDSTMDIISFYAQQDARVIPVSQENSFAGVARNTALEIARGSYVTFLDADDILANCAIEKMYMAAVANQADVVASNASHFEGTPEKAVPMKFWLKEELLPKANKFTPWDMIPFLFNFTVGGPAGKMISMELVRKWNLKFLDLRKSEDFFFIHRSFYRANCIAVVRDPIYLRRNTPTSLEHTLEKHPMVFYQAIEKFKQAMLEDGCYEVYKQTFINENVARFAYNLRSLRKDKEAYEKVLALFREIAEKELGLGYYPPIYYYSKPNYDYLMSLLVGAEKPQESIPKKTQTEQKNIALPAKQNTYMCKVQGGIACYRQNGFGYTLRYGCKKTAYWILRKLNGGINCCLEHGIIYTIRYAFKKMYRKIKK